MLRRQEWLSASPLTITIPVLSEINILMYVHVYEPDRGICILVYMCARGGQRTPSAVISQSLSISVFCDSISHWLNTLKLGDFFKRLLNWLADFQRPVCPFFPSAGIISMHHFTYFFLMWVLRFNPGPCVVCQLPYWLNHLQDLSSIITLKNWKPYPKNVLLILYKPINWDSNIVTASLIPFHPIIDPECEP